MAVSLGAVLLIVVVVTNVPGNPWVNWTRHRLVGHLLSHTAVLLPVIALYPLLIATMPSVARASRWRCLAGLAVVVVALTGAMAGLALVAPAAAHGLLTREWGLVEPLEFAALGIGALICHDAAQEVGRGHPRRPIYRAGTLVLVIMMLEEIDYLGLGATIAGLFGAKRGRIEDVYVGTLHDLLMLAAKYSLVALLPLLILFLLALPWLKRHAAALLAEARSWTSLPLVPAAILMFLAQADDLVGLRGWIVSPELTLVTLEEPLELLSLVCLDASLVLKLAREQEVRVTQAGRGGDRRAARGW